MYAYALGDALYLNLTSACTLACVFCPKIRDDDWVVGGFDLRLERAPSADEVWAQVEAGAGRAPEVVFTGLGEPTRRLEVVLELTRRLGGRESPRVRLDTDGLANLREGRDVAPELAAAGLDAVSSRSTPPTPPTYARLCPSRYGEAAWARRTGFHPRRVAAASRGRRQRRGSARAGRGRVPAGPPRRSVRGSAGGRMTG